MPIAILYYKVTPESINSAQIADWIEELPIIKQNKVKKLIQQKDQVLSLAGLQLLKKAMLAYPEYSFSLDQLEFPEQGKPFFKGDIDFNISHSGDIVCCVISDTSKVGVDIEVHRAIHSATLNKFLGKYPNLKKNSSQESDNHHFFKFWTKNEAIIKAADHGSIFNMSEIKYENEGAHYQNKFWSTYPVEMISKGDNKEYTCHIACSEKIENTAVSKIATTQIHNL